MITKVFQTTNEDLVREIHENPDTKEKNILLLYNRNLGFIYNVMRRFVHDISFYPDYQQLAYLAVTDAVNAFNPSKEFKYLSYLNKCLLHYFYNFSLEMHNVMKVPRSYKQTKYKVPSACSDECLAVTPYIDYEYDSVEFETMKSLVWQEVEQVLTPVNAKVIKDRYLHGKTLAAIGRELGIGKERVRQREINSLIRLSHSHTLQQLALDCNVITEDAYIKLIS